MRSIVILRRFYFDSLKVCTNSLCKHMKTSRTLLELCIDQEAQITGFTTNLSLSYTTRLRELGFREGEFVKCIKKPPLGAPRVFQICGSVFSMDTDIAREIELSHSL